ncbi:MAG: lipid asymmetry maintenance ABC transporter permease subunit MlaE [Gammaproteobacteria bacterium]|uniref:lipid asymmetry maintenance ABC transporter permease subunit MlaE n=1 Tax=Pseudomaricurvus alcaniphilus TaxID=1166482 RepID=UPI00140E351B|nr:lipid asymmetry maintenance ABC transporter permease subunit MlaE [Pseudomaricurvus alcaniphilus]MBR9913191.1 lipid asymmetry maintenance ABC transporter permease subunit MlaE [Gammaproteobacteria bacterium]NHN35773.1 lipid asymmetry maintenance ABC transporter permease subunit MlaE [Pseudomaricurvus alcaniphilus]
MNIGSVSGGLQRLGALVTNGLVDLGVAARFFVAILAASGICLRRPGLVIKEIYFIGVLSLVIILVPGLFVGLVLGLQMYDTLQRFGSGDIVGMVVALSLIRELGPVLSALLISSRAGSAVTAEIGLMKTTEQLSAMEMMAIQPVSRVIAPRFWAGIISVPLLTSVFNVVGIFGGYIVAVKLLGVDTGTFWSQIQESVDFRVDVVNGIIKSVFFGIAITFIAVFQGYHASPTAEGVSLATTQTVVKSAFVILAMDFVLTAFMFRGI